MKNNITIEIDDKDLKQLFGLEESKETEKEKVVEDTCSQYAKFFDDGCVGWSKDSEYCLLFLKMQQHYANDKLRAKGHIFLNEVYDMLGIPRTEAGDVVGWIYDEQNPYGDNFVDFGLNNKRAANFVNGYDTKVLLDFNVDGNILELL